jgi:hypothetical protein
MLFLILAGSAFSASEVVGHLQVIQNSAGARNEE